jgi:hypothetical protein
MLRASSAGTESSVWIDAASEARIGAGRASGVGVGALSGRTPMSGC